jgi:protein-S-isoprenylcysteine O-methyltransferase Ste14
MAKAIVFFSVIVASIYATVTIDPMPFAFFIPFTCVFTIFDAYRSAEVINMRHAGGAPLEDDTGLESPAWGIVLVILGLVLLMNNFGWLPIESLRRMWPILLIAAGGFILWGSFRRTREAVAPDAADAESESDV